MNLTEELKKQITDNFSRFESTLNGSKESSFHHLRKAAYRNLGQMEFPDTKMEEWRFTNLSPLLDHNFTLPVDNTDSSNLDISGFMIEGFDAHILVFVNGKYSPKLSRIDTLPKGSIIDNIGELINSRSNLVSGHFSKYADSGNNIFTCLNTAFTNDGIFVYIPENKTLDKPLYVLHIAKAEGKEIIIQPRNLIIAGNNSQFTVVENFVSVDDGVYFTNAVTEVICGERSVVEHIKLQNESDSSYHISTLQTAIEGKAKFSSCNISLGSLICRNNINVVFNGQYAESALNGLYLTHNSQLIDNHTSIEHAVPNCASNELYKGVLDDTSRAVFNGKVIVRPDAQKTNAFQQNRTILLSDSALINTTPQLEIYADDVKCSHGAAIGRLDEDSLFYLRARGIGYDQAKTILIYAFASDVIRSIKNDALKNYFGKLLAERLMNKL